MMETNKDLFTEWVVSKGVKIYGIAAHKFPGRGLGIVAQEKLEPGKTILTVPTSALHTIQTLPQSLLRSLPPSKTTTHSLLATSLCTPPKSIAPWLAVLPTQTSLLPSMPFTWPEPLQSLLPLPALTLLRNQQKKFSADWAAVSAAFPHLSQDVYLYNWLLINTRTFYYVVPGMKRPAARDDCMAMNPFADYFNHASRGCDVVFGADGYIMTADREYSPGEEVCISYGNHSNDFLLAEYGFVMVDGENEWDTVILDHVILPELSESQRLLLDEVGFLGEYVLDSKDVCHRTQVAIRILCVPLRRWHRFVKGLEDGEQDQAKVDQILIRLLKDYRKQAVKLKNEAVSLSTGTADQLQTLEKRWNQISLLLQVSIKRIQKS